MDIKTKVKTRGCKGLISTNSLEYEIPRVVNNVEKPTRLISVVLTMG